MLVKVLRSTVYPGKRLSAGEEVEIPKDEAKTLISMGKVVEIEARTDVVIDVDDDSLESMSKEELLRYADELGVEVAKSWTKEKIVATIEEELASAEDGDIE